MDHHGFLSHFYWSHFWQFDPSRSSWVSIELLLKIFSTIYDYFHPLETSLASFELHEEIFDHLDPCGPSWVFPNFYWSHFRQFSSIFTHVDHHGFLLKPLSIIFDRFIQSRFLCFIALSLKLFSTILTHMGYQGVSF